MNNSFINSYCLIRNNTILHNENLIYKDDNTSENFLIKAYEEGLHPDYPKFYKMDNLGKLGILACDALLKNFDFDSYKEDEVGIVLSNKNSSITADEKYYETANTFPSPALFVYTLPNIVIGEISIRYKFKGENAFFISEKFDAGWIYFYVNDLLQHQKIKTCICGWVEAVHNNYDACFFLVEQHQKNNILFTAAAMNKIYKS